MISGLRVDPSQRQRLADIRGNLTARIAEAEHEGWADEAEGLKVSLGMPSYRDTAASALGPAPEKGTP
jgi:hypothetical protein